MADFWTKIVALQGQTVRTVRGRRFTIDLVTNSSVIVTPASTGYSRTIERFRLENGHARKRSGTLLRPSDVQKEGISRFNSAYVAAIVNAIS